MRESLMYGSVRGTRGNSRPYRDNARFPVWIKTSSNQCACIRATKTSIGSMFRRQELEALASERQVRWQHSGRLRIQEVLRE